MNGERLTRMGFFCRYEVTGSPRLAPEAYALPWMASTSSNHAHAVPSRGNGEQGRVVAARTPQGVSQLGQTVSRTSFGRA